MLYQLRNCSLQVTENPTQMEEEEEEEEEVEEEEEGVRERGKLVHLSEKL